MAYGLEILKRRSCCRFPADGTCGHFSVGLRWFHAPWNGAAVKSEERSGTFLRYWQGVLFHGAVFNVWVRVDRLWPGFCGGRQPRTVLEYFEAHGPFSSFRPVSVSAGRAGSVMVRRRAGSRIRRLAWVWLQDSHTGRPMPDLTATAFTPFRTGHPGAAFVSLGFGRQGSCALCHLARQRPVTGHDCRPWQEGIFQCRWPIQRVEILDGITSQNRVEGRICGVP